MDSNLFYILIATGVISLLTLVYVVVDENLKQSRYAKEVAERKEKEQEELAKNPPVEAAETEPVDPASEPQPEDPVKEPEAEPVQTDEAEEPPAQA